MPVATLSPPDCIKMGSDESHFNVSLSVREKVTRQCPQTTTFEEKGEPKRLRTEVPLLTTIYQPNALPQGQTGSHQCLKFEAGYIYSACLAHPPSEFRSCVKVELAVLGSRPNEPYGFCGRKATLNRA